ncbi:hypothetical protein [Heliobacterium mobile]|nr:hypothetical protein [Heliobacterium mobile]
MIDLKELHQRRLEMFRLSPFPFFIIALIVSLFLFVFGRCRKC